MQRNNRTFTKTAKSPSPKYAQTFHLSNQDQILSKLNFRFIGMHSHVLFDNDLNKETKKQQTNRHYFRNLIFGKYHLLGQLQLFLLSCSLPVLPVFVSISSIFLSINQFYMLFKVYRSQRKGSNSLSGFYDVQKTQKHFNELSFKLFFYSFWFGWLRFYFLQRMRSTALEKVA